MSHHKVGVARDHVQTLIGASPQKAIVELIWNALDAGGLLVDVTLRQNDLNSIDTIGQQEGGQGRHVEGDCLKLRSSVQPPAQNGILR